MFRLSIVVVLLAALLAPALQASIASAPPVGPLPPGQATTVSTPAGSLVSIALPGQTASSGLVWRLARNSNGNVLRQISERNVGRDVVVVYRAVGRGQATIAYGLTKGETRKAYKSVTYKVTVR
jgi:hypothetical protein